MWTKSEIIVKEYLDPNQVELTGSNINKNYVKEFSQSWQIRHNTDIYNIQIQAQNKIVTIFKIRHNKEIYNIQNQAQYKYYQYSNSGTYLCEVTVTPTFFALAETANMTVIGKLILIMVMIMCFKDVNADYCDDVGDLMCTMCCWWLKWWCWL